MKLLGGVESKIVRKSIRRKEEGEREEKINKNNNRREIRSIQKMRKQGMEHQMREIWGREDKGVD